MSRLLQLILFYLKDRYAILSGTPGWIKKIIILISLMTFCLISIIVSLLILPILPPLCHIINSHIL